MRSRNGRVRAFVLGIVSSLSVGLVLLTFGLLVVVGSGAGGRTRSPASGMPGATGSLEPSPRPTQFTLAFPGDPDSVTVSEASYYGWALLDRRSGQVTGSANASTDGNTVESMIKPWIVADYLRQESERGDEPSEEALDELSLVIVDSNDPLAEKYYQLGGADDLVERLGSTCGLTRLTVEPGLWSMTTMTPLDAVRYGLCLADGRAAGAEWTPWVLARMREVRGSVADQFSGDVEGGRWGIIDGLPPELARDTSIKNGWTLYEDGWHVNCLAIHPDWVLSVMMRMPDDLASAAEACRSVASSLVVVRDGTAAKQ